MNKYNRHTIILMLSIFTQFPILGSYWRGISVIKPTQYSSLVKRSFTTQSLTQPSTTLQKFSAFRKKPASSPSLSAASRMYSQQPTQLQFPSIKNDSNYVATLWCYTSICALDAFIGNKDSEIKSAITRELSNYIDQRMGPSRYMEPMFVIGSDYEYQTALNYVEHLDKALSKLVEQLFKCKGETHFKLVRQGTDLSKSKSALTYELSNYTKQRMGPSRYMESMFVIGSDYEHQAALNYVEHLDKALSKLNEQSKEALKKGDIDTHFKLERQKADLMRSNSELQSVLRDYEKQKQSAQQ